MKFLKQKYFILIITAVFFVSLTLILFLKFGWLGNEIQVVTLHLDDKIIEFPNTDDNDQESLIIKSDQGHYTGDSGSDVYFSITNTSKKDESAILLFYFPGQFIPNQDDPPGTQPATITSLEEHERDSWQKLEFFAKNIKINDDLLGKAITKRKPIPEDFEIKAGTQIEVRAGQTVYFKSRISFRSTDSGEFWIEALGKNGGYGLLDPTYSGTHFGSQTSTDSVISWFASGSQQWTNRKKISINKSMVSGGSNLSNFPVLFSVIDTTLKTTAFSGKAASGSGEFVFTSSNGTTVLPHEIEKYSSSSGEFIGWVNVTTLSITQDTSIYMYYGGPAAGANTNQNKTGTFATANNYQGVWHLKEDPTATCSGTKETCDSTSNANHADATNMESADLITGKISGGHGYDGTNEYDIAPDSNSLDIGTSNITASLWFKTSTLANAPLINKQDNDAVSKGYAIYIRGTGTTLRFDMCDTACTTWAFTPPVLADNNWHNVTFTVDRASTTGLKGYFEGNLLTTQDPTARQGSLANTTGFTIATDVGGGAGAAFFNGNADEVRISDTVRSSDWIKTEYNNQSSPSTFYSLGGLEAQTPNGPGLKIKGGVKFR